MRNYSSSTRYLTTFVEFKGEGLVVTVVGSESWFLTLSHFLVVNIIITNVLEDVSSIQSSQLFIMN